MEFESSAAVAKKKKKKEKKYKKKKSRNKNAPNVTTSNAEELAAFLFHLDMNHEDEETIASTSPWVTDNDKEKEMSASYINALTSPDRNFLEAEFLRQFRTHLAWKQFLSGTEPKNFKDRIFLLMAKEQEATQSGDSARRILYEHFLYEELRLQHQYLTTPQVSDTPNDIALKVTMVPVICGLIRNCNESRDTVCLDIKDDDEESEALFKVPLSTRGSCLTSILRPLYQTLRARHTETLDDKMTLCNDKDSADNESDTEEIDTESKMELISILPSDLQVLCCGGGRENISPQKCDRFFEGPPEWHRNLPFFMKRIQYSNPTPERTGYIKHSLRKVQALRVVQEQRQFYEVAYGNACLHATPKNECRTSGDANRSDISTLELPFTTHVMLHRSCNALVTLRASASPPADSDPMTLSDFKRLVTVQLPRLLVTPCSRCHIPCTGECVCGRSYCSAACLAADQCSGCEEGSCDELLYLTPIAWGRAPIEAS